MVIGGHRRSVVVKVRHPGVEVRIKQDFQLLKPLAAAASQAGFLTPCTLAPFATTLPYLSFLGTLES